MAGAGKRSAVRREPELRSTLSIWRCAGSAVVRCAGAASWENLTEELSFRAVVDCNCRLGRDMQTRFAQAPPALLPLGATPIAPPTTPRSGIRSAPASTSPHAVFCASTLPACQACRRPTHTTRRDQQRAHGRICQCNQPCRQGSLGADGHRQRCCRDDDVRSNADHRLPSFFSGA